MVHFLLLIVGRNSTSTMDGDGSTDLLLACSKKGEASLVDSRACLSSSEQSAAKLLAGEVTAQNNKQVSEFRDKRQLNQ